MKKRANNDGKYILLSFLVAILILSSFFLVLFMSPSETKGECEKDSDCVKKQITCCPCNTGGKEICMNKENATEFQLRCPSEDRIICPAVFNCMETECLCRNGECVER
jgi:hypothetical protein